MCVRVCVRVSASLLALLQISFAMSSIPAPKPLANSFVQHEERKRERESSSSNDNNNYLDLHQNQRGQPLGMACQMFCAVCEMNSESGYVESNESNENPDHSTRAIVMGKFKSPIVDGPIDDPLHQRTRRQMPTTNTILEESHRPPPRGGSTEIKHECERDERCWLRQHPIRK